MISALKGMRDLFEQDGELYQKIIKTCEEVAQNYGFSFINAPHLEFSKLFRRSVGESSDIVGKEMYEFIDKGGNEVCLRPEGTAGVVRAYIEAKFDKQNATKHWFYHGSMFRYERPQKGRLREFHQFGVESFGTKSVFEDANLIFMLVEIFARLGIEFKLLLNSLGCQNCLPIYREKLLEFLGEKELCDDCARRKKSNPIRVLDCKNEVCQSFLKFAPKINQCLCDDCAHEFKLLQELLTQNGVEFELDDKLVRGLDYYSKTAFEFVSSEIGAKAAIAGGGRYDRLISYLGGRDGFGVGFALGIERLIAILEQKQSEKKRNGIYLCALNESFLPQILKIAKNLRQNHVVFMSYDAKKLAKALENADKNGAEIFLCLGENEAQNESIFYKNLESKEEKQILIKNLEQNL